MLVLSKWYCMISSMLVHWETMTLRKPSHLQVAIINMIIIIPFLWRITSHSFDTFQLLKNISNLHTQYHHNYRGYPFNKSQLCPYFSAHLFFYEALRNGVLTKQTNIRSLIEVIIHNELTVIGVFSPSLSGSNVRAPMAISRSSSFWSLSAFLRALVRSVRWQQLWRNLQEKPSNCRPLIIANQLLTSVIILAHIFL